MSGIISAVPGDRWNPALDVKGLRVLFLDYQFRRVGGLETYNLETVRTLRRLGADVKVWSCFASGNQEVEGVPTRGLAPPDQRWLGLYRRWWRCWLALNLALLRWPVDLLVVGHVFLVCQGVWGADRRGIPCWMLAFGVEIWNPLPRRFGEAIARCDRIVAVSRYTAGQAARLLPGIQTRLTVVHPAVDADRFCPGSSKPSSTASVVLTVARLSSGERYKGHDLIIRALPRLQAALDRPVEYWVAGEGDDRSRLEMLAAELGVATVVRFLGRVEDRVLLDCYRRCDVFAMPSFVTQRPDGFRTGEGFGIVYLEASACGKPVLASDEGGQTEAIRHGETGLLVKPTPEAVADGLTAILRNPELSRTMGMNGRRFVEQGFTLAHFDARWRTLLAAVVVRGRTRRPMNGVGPE